MINRWREIPTWFVPFLRFLAVESKSVKLQVREEVGIVICAGGKYAGPAKVLVHLLRGLRCMLPIQMWRLPWEDPVDVPSVTHRVGTPNERKKPGYSLKAIALYHCGFRKAFLLDADAYPVTNPELILGQLETCLAWSGTLNLDPKTACAFTISESPAWETGVLAVDRSKCGAALAVAEWLCNWSDRSFRMSIGDPEAFQAGFELTETPFTLVPGSRWERVGLVHQNLTGQDFVWHRCLDKEWKQDSAYPFESQCKEWFRNI